jgi:hypothetical protein
MGYTRFGLRKLMRSRKVNPTTCRLKAGAPPLNKSMPASLHLLHGYTMGRPTQIAERHGLNSLEAFIVLAYSFLSNVPGLYLTVLLLTSGKDSLTS